MSTTIDHTAIDLDELKRHYGPSFGTGSTADLAALADEIEALRERNIKLSRKNGEYAFAMGEANERAEAAEARVIELEATK